MDEMIKNAFDSIKAEPELKASAKSFVDEKYAYRPQKTALFPQKAFATAAACLILIIGTFISAYSIPVSAISIDGDTSSVELGVNCFYKVVKVNCFGNEDTVNSLNLKNRDYMDAVSVVIEITESYSAPPVVTVIGNSDGMCNRITEEILAGHSDSTHIQHHAENHGLSDEAHKHGISNGKYNAYLTLKKYEPYLTVEEAAVLTMKELRERIAVYEGGNASDGTPATTFPCSSEHHSEEKGKHHGNGHQ